MRFKNISTAGALDLPLIGRIIGAGEEFEVPADLGEQLELQPDIFEWLDRPEKDLTVAELQDQLRALDLPISGRKSELVARLTEAEGTDK